MSATDAFRWDDTLFRPQGQADTTPDPSLFETAAAGFRAARDDQTGHTDEERQSAYGPVVTALIERGYDARRYVNPYGGQPINYDVVWQDIDAVRRSDPNAFKDLGDRDAFENGWRSRFAQRQARDANTLRRGRFVGSLAGGIAGSLTDPINVGSMALTGGSSSTSVAGRILLEGVLNAGIELAQTPLTIAERKKQGRELTGEELAMNLGFAAAGGAAFKGLEIGVPKLAGMAWDKLPLETRAAIALRRAVPDYALSPDQAAALHVFERGAEVDASNPFAGTYENLEAHARRIDETLAAMARWPEPSTVQAVPSIARPVGHAMGMLRVDFENAWRAIIGNEGGTARDGSFLTSPVGAIGPAQVMPGTAPEAARLAGLPWDEARYRSDHAYNVALGQAYYRDLLRQFDNDPVKAAAAYNAGPGSIRRGTGLRGAMARAERAGVPSEWVSFLPAETRKYVENFRRRTGMQAGETIDGVLPAFDADGAVVRPVALDAERPVVDVPDRTDMPALDRERFRSDEEWQRAQAEVDAERVGTDPAAARQAVWIAARDRLMTDKAGEVHGALWHPELGSIDVKWGDAATGLAKIVERHPEVLDDLPALLEHMEIEDRSREGRVTLESMDHTAVVRLDWDNKEQNWLLTAFQREEPRTRAEAQGKGGAPSPADNMRAGDIAGASPTAGAMRNIALGRAGVQLGEGVGDFARWWDREFAQTGRNRSVHAIVDGTGIVRGWETTGPRARRQLDRLGIEDGRVAELAPPSREEAAGHAALQDELEAQRLAGPVVNDAEAARVFDDPGGDAVGRVADLAWHDAQMTAAKYQGAKQLTFDLGDGRGERSIAEIEAELKADDDAISTIEGCLAPAPLGGAA